MVKLRAQTATSINIVCVLVAICHQHVVAKTTLCRTWLCRDVSSDGEKERPSEGARSTPSICKGARNDPWRDSAAVDAFAGRKTPLDDPRYNVFERAWRRVRSLDATGGVECLGSRKVHGGPSMGVYASCKNTDSSSTIQAMVCYGYVCPMFTTKSWRCVHVVNHGGAFF